MPEPIVVTPEVTPKVETPVVVATPEDKSILGDAKEAEQTPEEKAVVDAENKRLMDADDASLKPEELAKKNALKAEIDGRVPEKYEVKVPEGMSVDQALLDAVSPVLKKHNVSQAAFNEIVDVYAPHIKAMVEGQQKASLDAWNAEIEGWKTQTLKELGANADKEMSFAAKFLDKFGSRSKGEDGKEVNDLRVLLNETGLGNNPILTKALIAAGKAISTDSFVDPNKGVSGGGLENFYDHPTSKANLKT